MMEKEDFLNSGLLELYILGLASKEEIEEVEKHLKLFPELKKEVKAGKSAIENYAQQYVEGVPNNLTQELSQTQSENGHSTSMNNNMSSSNITDYLWKGWAIAASIIAALLFFNNTSNSTTSEVEGLKSEIVKITRDCEAEKTRLKEYENVFAFFNHKRTETLFLGGLSYQPNAQAIVFWNEELQQVFCNPFGLPPLDKNHQYQVWADVDGEMVSLGLLGDLSEELHPIEFIANAVSYNITVEPKGGSAHPHVDRLTVNGIL